MRRAGESSLATKRGGGPLNIRMLSKVKEREKSIKAKERASHLSARHQCQRKLGEI